MKHFMGYFINIFMLIKLSYWFTGKCGLLNIIFEIKTIKR